MSEKLLTAEEVARYLSMSEGDIKELVRRGELPAYRIGGTFLRFKLEQVKLYSKRRDSDIMAKRALLNDRGTRTDLTKSHITGRLFGSGQEHLKSDKGVPYGFWEKVEDFLYYNDFYILSLILLILVVFAVFEL